MDATNCVRINSPEELKSVQEAMFAKGYIWPYHSNRIVKDNPYINYIFTYPSRKCIAWSRYNKKGIKVVSINEVASV